MPGQLLKCPIRGPLTVESLAADGLKYSEEKRRIDCIRFLLAKGCPPENFKIETTLLRFGHQGKNSFRTDVAVLDVPVSGVPDDLEEVKSHIKLIAEIKRDNAGAKLAKETQVYPALAFLSDISARGVYWDDVEQRLFFRTLQGSKTTTHEIPLALLPRWGQAVSSTELRTQDLQAENLLGLFQKIEDRLHATVADKSKRISIILQLLLAKMYDEHSHPAPIDKLSLQDFADAPLTDTEIKNRFEKTLAKAVAYYGKYLPNEVPSKLPISGSVIRGISSLLAPLTILRAKRDVVQDFYMYFAQGVYRWDMAQYFTPTEVVDFIVTLVISREVIRSKIRLAVAATS